mgnify:CR=1 FL=1
MINLEENIGLNGNIRIKNGIQMFQFNNNKSKN